MSPNTDTLWKFPIGIVASRNGPIRANSIGEIMNNRNGAFHAINPSESRKATHNHLWIFGHDNAVCTKCGYTLPKDAELPQRGLASMEEAL